MNISVSTFQTVDLTTEHDTENNGNSVGITDITKRYTQRDIVKAVSLWEMDPTNMENFTIMVENEKNKNNGRLDIPLLESLSYSRHPFPIERCTFEVCLKQVSFRKT